ncbi:thioesterase II family protein [Streptomyces scopuliridis]|uniref:thioesterase II family protein n=1 Tax=Streptomyces scopuliridis TaxID=452529 RepID=UPI003687E63C
MNHYVAARSLGEKPLNLFCFHHAGAGAMTFARWQRRVGTHISVIPVRLPGRETRLREPRITDAEELMDELGAHLGPLLDRPHAFYGHSLGALVAYRFALRRTTQGHPAPVAVAVGACNAPHLPTAFIDAIDPTDEWLLRTLTHWGDVPRYLLESPQWLRTTLATLRDDFRLARSLRAASGAPLPCPVPAFAGRDDVIAPPSGMRLWSRYTTAAFALRTVPGGHFFVRDGELPRLLPAALGIGTPPRPVS